ncbi:MAG: ABC transporter substrate-binding protein [Actinomycetota bacterium]
MNERISKSRVRFFAVAAVVGVLAPACSSSSPAASDVTSTAAGSTASSEAVVNTEVATPKSGGNLVVGIDAEATGWSPQNDAWGHGGHDVARAIFDTLAVYDPAGVARPYLAESITANADSTVWTIKVRPGVTFHDGDPLTADAVKQNFDAALASPIEKGALTLLSSMKVVDDLTLELTMSKPWGAFPNALTGGFAGQLGYMAAPKMLASPEGSRNPDGTGPFVFKEWIPDDHLTVVRNDKYWQKPALLDSVEFRPITNSDSRKAAFASGDIDVIATANAPEVKSYLDLESKGKVHVVKAPPSDPDVILLNTSKPPLNDIRVRKAMAMALDLNRIVDFLEGTGVKEVATGPYPKDSFWYYKTDYPQFDAAAAKKLIDEYTAEKGPIKLEYAGNQDPFIVSFQELIQSMWADVGITADIVSRAQGENVGAVLGGKYDVTGWGGIGGDDPDNDYNYFHSGTGLDLTKFSSPALDAALDKGRALSDPAARKEQYDIVQKELAANVPFLWLEFTGWTVVGQGKVMGLDAFTLPDGSPGRPLTAARFYLKDVWLDQ